MRPDLVHYLLYKPVGVISAASDPHGRRTVVDLLPGGTRLYPVGRLDFDSEGLIVVTNDGELANVLTHPRFGIEKVYVARVRGHPTVKALRSITHGVELDDGPARAHRARVTSRSGDESLIEIVMTEGRNREVRRLLAAVGHEPTTLVRTAIGPIRDPNLSAGAWRLLTIEEIRALHAAADGGSR